ncbi:uncharacterized protein NDAI_0B00720 [Naumovozyma dairenensis CBS 421]|uniref:Ceramide synthase subunit LIP1 n=1 Tax=Naumovozyma dairenensis (strain ATCC 10597 / BCRC 20456 / CBS 421 / NBRC 0211 / NRRL Y-12639) TaxID=1071378 RepID=G0W5P5_NAUDC|nr:hypothetical protein NDAI_0B00720 [Naumovozyma dairenensis CBS 421]CCD23106.1 hypothetical protein NDAI_0B00720 [Naumovozyma dairenensis CBS 421]
MMSQRSKQIRNLFLYILIALSLIAAVEYFKYSTRIHYEWFHCTAIKEPIPYDYYNQEVIDILDAEPSSSVVKYYARGGPSCDKRGEFKTIIKRITRDFEPNLEHYSFCIFENFELPQRHYPIDENKGAPGYVAYVGYDSDSKLVERLCNDSTIYHM